ncbi:MAG TPA: 5-formyltetrahydrofolate cyclo-ligase [Usitatibacter sp.]|nr:5-formyltetrahydrofolate cyclo-ligase [Usitatibacter sp.]
MTDPVPEKKRLRQELIARRDALAPAERARLGALLMERVLALPEFARARSVLTTMTIGSELDTAPLIAQARAAGKTVILPRVSEPPRRLEIYAVEDPRRDLVPGIWDIPEPDPARCRRVALSEVDFALVPALAIDRGRYRLGYGAGFFDGLLAGRGARPLCVTALPAAFHVESLPHDAHDVPVDLAISEAS